MSNDVILNKIATIERCLKRIHEEYDADSLVKRLHDHALFIAFAPAENPEFVVAIIVENGGSGSKVAAPIARKMIKQYFGITDNE